MGEFPGPARRGLGFLVRAIFFFYIYIFFTMAVLITIGGSLSCYIFIFGSFWHSSHRLPFCFTVFHVIFLYLDLFGIPLIGCLFFLLFFIGFPLKN